MKLTLVIAAFAVLTACGNGMNNGSGKNIGQIVKIAKHGILCTTGEAELVRGGFSGGSGVNGVAFHFSIPDETLFSQLERSMEAQQEIELFYDRRFMTGPCTSESDYFATGFRVLQQPERTKAKPQPEDDSAR